MKKTAIRVAPLLLVLMAFFAWHAPMRGPLTEAEIDAFMANQPETGGTHWTDIAAVESFLRNDDGRPFLMINLMQLRDTAAYPEGSEFNTDITAHDAGVLYGQAVLPLLLQRGSYPVARASRHATIINSVGQSAGAFDSFAMVRYRSRRDLLDMLASDAFLAAEVHKWASLENTLVAPAGRLQSFGFIGTVPIVIALCIAGLVLHGVTRRD